jgi:hypothetical protein
VGRQRRRKMSVDANASRSHNRAPYGFSDCGHPLHKLVNGALLPECEVNWENERLARRIALREIRQRKGRATEEGI